MDAQRRSVTSQGHTAWDCLFPFLRYRNRVKRKEKYTRLCDPFRRQCHRNGGVVTNIFCTVFARMCGLETHHHVSVVLWGVPTAFELGVDSKIAQHSRALQGKVSCGMRQVPQKPFS